MKVTTRVEYSLNLFFVYVLCLVLLGGYFYEFYLHYTPCALCYLQRIGLIGLSLALLLNIKEMIRPRHYGLALIAALFGAAVSLRHTALVYCCSDAPSPVLLGLSLFQWAFVAFYCSFVAIGVLLLFPKSYERYASQKKMYNCAFAAILVLIMIGFLSVLWNRGLSF